MGHRSGESRQQAALFPVLLDELVGEHALARGVDAWVEALGSEGIGLCQGASASDGSAPL